MYLFTVIGATGTGKSPFIKKFMKGRNCLVFDVQNEYGSRTKYPGQIPELLSDNPFSERARYTVLDEKKFIEVCNKRRNTICVFEEATGFFEGKTERALRRLMLSKMHTGNIYMFVFHSVNSVPPRLMEMTDYIILFKTGDELHNVQRKFPKLERDFIKVNALEKGEYITIKNV